jgi:ring-1,2-phenylacetyl-CoA epoxidase subunit PaaD
MHEERTSSTALSNRQALAWAAAAEVVDPEIPVLTIADLGVLRDVQLESDGTVLVTITPTYTGCPAMNMFEMDIQLSLAKAGFEKARIETVLHPAWTTDWLTQEAHDKLEKFGIAPPKGKASRRALFGEDSVNCPKCGSSHTERVSEFGSTACKALYRCTTCAEPFDYFKCI